MPVPETLRERGFPNGHQNSKTLPCADLRVLRHGTFTEFSSSHFDCPTQFSSKLSLTQTAEGGSSCAGWSSAGVRGVGSTDEMMRNSFLQGDPSEIDDPDANPPS